VPPTLTGTVDTIDHTTATMTAANNVMRAIHVPGLAGLIRVSSCSGDSIFSTARDRNAPKDSTGGL
jgi:hypothetical protein